MSQPGGSLLLFWSRFNLRGAGQPPAGEDWVEDRFRHWLTFTLPSILGQDEEDLRYWLLCDRAASERTEPLRACLRDERVRLIYPDQCPGLLRRLPRRGRYLLARIDSDDLYHPSVASTLLRQPASTEFFQFNQGYACDVDSGEVRRWNSRSSPFYTHVYGEELRARTAWAEPNHTSVRARATVLEPERFMVALHGRNTSSSIRLGGERLAPRPALTVLRSFGLGGVRPLRSVLASARGPADWAAREASLHAALGPLYRRYLDGGTSEATSISLETAVFFGFLCEAVGARRILDLGSGFGSVVAARYAAAHPSVVSHSVELSAERLARSRRALQRLGLPTTGLRTWPEFLARREARYDLVLHDLDGMAMRTQTLPTALEAVLPTGLLLLDDSHKRAYAAGVSRQLERWCADVVPQAEELTRDRFGRSTLLLARVVGPLDRGSPIGCLT